MKKIYLSLVTVLLLSSSIGITQICDNCSIHGAVLNNASNVDVCIYFYESPIFLGFDCSTVNWSSPPVFLGSVSLTAGTVNACAPLPSAGYNILEWLLRQAEQLVCVLVEALLQLAQLLISIHST